MEIGDDVIYRGRVLVLLGHDPMSVPDRHAQVEDPATGERFDVLVSPTSPSVAFELGAKTANPLAMYLSDLLTIPSCMAGLPGLNIPCGLSEGLPVGLQLIGPQFAENTLFRVGHALEQAIGFDPVPARLAS